ncbi:sarcosine oxidase subunit gamma [Marinomonas aquiplantarum]|uniref:N-methylglutamate dehydrogenase subunit D n=1 Tax=Marinomonas aquiplantarum TaxID=491951 RepID=A0A366D264_9GAMM|nr:sarcosine oxidase subunit gamma [Marinomonas aquiplantarum]RBO84153.1 N-methylglutamate dehydrogenase subunit D [Marinomonas aquiplantarum]
MESFSLSAVPNLRKSRIDLSDTGSSTSSIRYQDCTVNSRVGFRGQGAASFLTSQGLPIPSQANQSLLFEDSLVVLRLSKTEFWLVDIENTYHELIEKLELSSEPLEDVYRLFCQHSHACFLFSGEQTASMFSKVCGVDLRGDVFPVGSIAQTSVARVNAIVARQEGKGKEYYLLLSDLASSQYLWEALLDAGSEFA